MTSSFFKTVPFLFLLTLFAGCMSFDYVGQSFAPKAESAAVTIFNGRTQIPADEFRIIGRGTLTGANSNDEYDRLAALREEARKHGADAVCIVDTAVKAVGYFPRSEGAFAPPLSASVNVDNLNSRGETWETDSFGQVSTLNTREKVRYNFEIKCLFLKKSGDFNKEMKERTPFL